MIYTNATYAKEGLQKKYISDYNTTSLAKVVDKLVPSSF